MENKDINVLNNVLEGTYMGIDSYSKFMNNIDNPDLRHKLEDQEMQYRESASQLASHIRNLGGNAKDNPGLKGVVTTVTNTMKLLGEDKTVRSLEMIKDGIKTAIDAKEEAIDKVSSNSKQLLQNQLESDKTILNEIQSFISEVKH